MNEPRPIGEPAEHELHAYVDGRLAPARRAEIQAWLDAHPDRAEEVDAWKRDAEALRALSANAEAWPDNPALQPAAIRRRLRARRRRRLALAASLVGAIGLGGVLGWAVRDFDAARSMPMADAVAAYRQVVESDVLPMEFRGDHAAELDRWLVGRFGEAGRVPDLTPAGYQLLGGQLLSTEQGPAVMLVYRDRAGARVGVYVRPRGRLPRDGERRDGGLLAQYWSEQHVSFAIVSAGDDPTARRLPLLLRSG
ncbi:anti-sigma factor family protein [Arenimonas terrae]|jgi:anti-sigma factor RsiW|uniref:Anti-sigma factor n=1 Tax=Arenimonas terrae TaxID=2546226 RepID=A0A5C4RPF3_9GAMM|nr:anti-sigma factor [Arenimonas terrae]TNJ33133.1 anti-sigma factor [Arenimonas terrae]